MKAYFSQIENETIKKWKKTGDPLRVQMVNKINDEDD
jgi:hypothetical protein